MTPITFPGLGLEFDIDQVAFTVFGKPIYWYGIIIALGFLLGVTLGCKLAPKMNAKPDDLMDMMLFAMPLGIIGARIYYVLFYQELYRDAEGVFQWGRVFSIRDGGLAIYGGIIAAVLTSVIFCKIRKISFLPLGDSIAPGILVGQLMGRWGNFFNQEAYGGPCTAPWRMGLIENGVPVEVHPTFLYESLWNLLGLFLLLKIVMPRRKFPGQVFFSYILWYGMGRFWIEGLRTDSLYLFGTGIRVSQALALVSAVTALIIILTNLKKANAPAADTKASKEEK